MEPDSNIIPLALQPPDEAIRIRPVRAEDLTALRADCWSARPLIRCQDLLRRVLDARERKRGLGIVVEDEIGETLVAYGQAIQWTRCVEISDLMVSTVHRSKGIGTAMIQYLIANIQPPRPDCVEIGVAESNPRALTLYRRLGFKEHYSIFLDVGNGKEKVSYLRIVFANYEDKGEEES